MYPWFDYGGRLSPFKLMVFIALFVPGTWVAVAYATDMLGARPLNDAIHQIGLWGVRFLFIALAITPVRQILQWSRLILVRRMVGVASFVYIAIHLMLYIADQAFDLEKVALEIVFRIYLTIGFTALLGLTALAVTSTDGMVRRLGRRWQQLHRLVYPIAVLALIHYFMQSKSEVWEPTVFAGFFGWLMAYRLLHRKFAVRGRLPLPWVAALSVAMGPITALGEALYFWIFIGVDPLRVLPVNFTLLTGVRPSWVVLGAGLALTGAGLVRQFAAPAGGRRAKGGLPPKKDSGAKISPTVQIAD